MTEGPPKLVERKVSEIEGGPEQVLTKSEVMEGVQMFVENAQIRREESDEHGLYLLEAVVEGSELGETVEYGYVRQGKSPGHEGALETAIHRTYYSQGVPISGEKVAVFSEGKWIEKDN